MNWNLPFCWCGGSGGGDGDGGVTVNVLGRRAPSEAKLQLARRPLITGIGSSQAFFAVSGSLNVT